MKILFVAAPPAAQKIVRRIGEVAKQYANVEVDIKAVVTNRPERVEIPAGTDWVLAMNARKQGAVLKDRARRAGASFVAIPPNWVACEQALRSSGFFAALDRASEQEVLTHRPLRALGEQVAARHMSPPPVAQPRVQVRLPLDAPLSGMAAADAPQGRQEAVAAPEVPEPAQAPPSAQEAATAGTKAAWRSVETTTGEQTRTPVNPWIATRILRSKQGGDDAKRLLVDGLMNLDVSDGYEQYVTAQEAAGRHAISDGLWRELRLTARADAGLPDDTASWSGKTWGNSTPSERAAWAKEHVRTMESLAGVYLLRAVRGRFGIGVNGEVLARIIESERRRRTAGARAQATKEANAAAPLPPPEAPAPIAAPQPEPEAPRAPAPSDPIADLKTAVSLLAEPMRAARVRRLVVEVDDAGKVRVPEMERRTIEITSFDVEG